MPPMKKLAVFLTIVVLALSGCMSETPDLTQKNSTGIINVGPSFGDDGTWFLFSSNRAGGGGNVYRFDLGGTQVVELTSEVTDEWTSPGSVSPNGNLLLYETNRTGSYSLWLKNFANKGLALYRGEGTSDIRHPAFSQDGTRVAYAKRGGQSAYSKIYVVNLDGTGEKVVTTGDFHDYRPTWTRDKKIVFYRYIGTQTDIFIVNPEQAGSEINLTRSTDVDEFDPVCAHASDTIYFAQGKVSGGAGRIISMKTDSTNPTNVTALDGHYRDIAISKDDTKLIWMYQAPTSANLDLYLANAAGVVIRQLTDGATAPK